MSDMPTVSDHALVRYLECVLGFDFDTIRQRILTNEVKMAMEVGAARFPLPGEPDHEMIIKKNVVVTIQPDSLKEHKQRLISTRGCRSHVECD